MRSGRPRGSEETYITMLLLISLSPHWTEHVTGSDDADPLMAEEHNVSRIQVLNDVLLVAVGRDARVAPCPTSRQPCDGDPRRTGRDIGLCPHANRKEK